MPVQVKACWKTDEERNDKSHDVRADWYKSDMQNLFVKNKIITDEVHKDIQESVTASTCNVAEGLDRKPFAEWRIKEIY